VRIARSGWEKALSLAVPTSFEPAAFRSPQEWGRAFDRAPVHLQWDTERTLRGAALPYFSIQVGLGRGVIREYAEEWIAGVDDLTPRVRQIHDLLRSGRADKARRLLPPERVYPVPSRIGRQILITG
jgi:hypothetical protein